MLPAAAQLPTELSPDMYSPMSTSVSASGVQPSACTLLMRAMSAVLFPLATGESMTPPSGSLPESNLVSPKRTLSLNPSGLIRSITCRSAFLAVSRRSIIGMVGVASSMICWKSQLR